MPRAKKEIAPIDMRIIKLLSRIKEACQKLNDSVNLVIEFASGKPIKKTARKKSIK